MSIKQGYPRGSVSGRATGEEMNHEIRWISNNSLKWHKGRIELRKRGHRTIPTSNNADEYEAYLTRLAITLSMGIKHKKVLGDSNLMVSQVKGDFQLRERSLASFRTWAQKVEGKF